MCSGVGVWRGCSVVAAAFRGLLWRRTHWQDHSHGCWREVSAPHQVDLFPGPHNIAAGFSQCMHVIWGRERQNAHHQSLNAHTHKMEPTVSLSSDLRSGTPSHPLQSVGHRDLLWCHVGKIWVPTRMQGHWGPSWRLGTILLSSECPLVNLFGPDGYSIEPWQGEKSRDPKDLNEGHESSELA